VLVRVEAGALRATGFRADQGSLLDAALGHQGAEAFADLGAVGTFQTPLVALQAEIGMSFADLVAHDTYALEAAQGIELHALDEAAW
jgi:hypothetical protein